MLEAMRITLNDPDVFAVTAFLAGLIGVCVGSFLNVVIYRLPRGMSLAMPPSHCPSCNRRLRWFENIPILSYLFLRGRCRTCRARISPRYTVVELANGALWVAAVFMWRSNILMAVVAALAVSVCLCVCFIDWEQGMIPDRFHIMLALLAIPATLLDTYDGWTSHVIGAAAGGAALALVGFLVSKRIGREALGWGDVKFVAVSGAFLGWKRLLLTLLLASVGGCLWSLIRRRGEKQKTVAFGPFLTFGFMAALFAGEPIIRAYLSLFAW